MKVGKIVGCYGVNGYLKFFSYIENENVLKSIDNFFIENSNNKKNTHKPLMLKKYKRGFLLLLEGINNRNLAEQFVGKEVFTNNNILPKLDEDTYYWNDLLGISVFENNKPIGKIASVIETGTNDVYIVKNEKEEILIPALNSYVLSVDIKNKRMDVKLPEYF